MINATLAVPRAQVRFVSPTRTQPHTAASVTVDLYTPNSVFGDRFNQLDVAINKTIVSGWARLIASLDIYNALNSSSIQSVITAVRYGVAAAKLVPRRRACCGSPGTLSF